MHARETLSSKMEDKEGAGSNHVVLSYLLKVIYLVFYD
ncbi:hypothetical protein SLEP1_g53018 [Rubroshorea leprosula]|uniref:Uncharacterized protein n=1 Tax=Rubroshorea leprosula TaxID=152421 RepID=A0AAV5M896_9ROSI|nr:hypothetical protein SLEP1_g53018 [Rubroshorea leprosula]